jgi:hypothetical protein
VMVVEPVNTGSFLLSDFTTSQGSQVVRLIAAEFQESHTPVQIACKVRKTGV